ncbi:MAG: restriction endonuclease-like protein [Pseudomonadales bacterium]|nr:restriction endonuclease-like protein [Pseudomonadales bacterium]
MPELVALKTKHYDYVIWSKNVYSSQQRLARTLTERGLTSQGAKILFSPPISLKNQEKTQEEFLIPRPVFFENKQYDIEFVFDQSFTPKLTDNPPYVSHRLRSIEDSFHFSERSHSLRGSINTGNNIGWFKIELVYKVDKKTYRQSFAFEVLPTKMNMASDLQQINATIDEVFPLWRFSLAEKTQHQMKAVKQPHSQFLLLWLAQFELLRGELNKGLKQVVNAPHSRLVNAHQSLRMDRLAGRLSPKLEQEVSQAKASSQWDKRFQLNKKQLSVDTPENQFIKALVISSINKLAKIKLIARKNQNTPENQRLSESFFSKLDDWQSSMRIFQRQPLFKEVGDFTGLTKGSLVLQQKPGYARVYKIWQQLKWYLELLAGQDSLSLRSIAELYEVWCFLEVRRILMGIGFNETQSNKIPLVNNGIEVSFKDGMGGAFLFEREDGVKIRLAHEPKFKTNGRPIKSWITTQVPDIFLEASFPDGQVISWIFDAKYRIRHNSNYNDNAHEEDMVPDDAINQMHRYRDALIHQNDTDTSSQIFKKSRPVFGAYALYPGFYDQKNTANPYEEAIEQVGIGAFSLLPDSDHNGSYWLTRFLEEKLQHTAAVYGKAVSDQYYVEEAPRISSRGTTVSRFKDLTIAANQLGPNRTSEYIRGFKQGEAQYYHTKSIAFKRQNIERNVVSEAQYIAVAINNPSSKTREIKFIYPILSACRKKRSEITAAMAGADSKSNPNEMYWLFELGKSFRLDTPISQTKNQHFEVKLVERHELLSNRDWSTLKTSYGSLMRQNTTPNG